jgi:hypothetical protein
MAYAVTLLIIVSVTILIRNRKIRKHYVLGGLCALPLVIIDPLLRTGYFEQLTTAQLYQYFLTQALTVFMFGGLSAVLYELVFSTHFTKQRSSTRQHPSVFLIGLVIGMSLFLFGVVPLVTAVIVGLAINVVLLMLLRSDLFWDATFSAIGTGLLYAVLFSLITHGSGSLTSLWFTEGLSGATVAGLPLEELIVVALFGAFFGSIYSAAKSLYER